MSSLETHLVEAGVLSAELLAQAQERVRRAGVSLWEALYALDAEFIARALETKRAYYYRQDAQQFKAAREIGQPLNLRAYFPPELQRVPHQKGVVDTIWRLTCMSVAPVAWTKRRIWIVGERPVGLSAAFRTCLVAGACLSRLPAPREQVEDYLQLLHTFLWDSTGMVIEGPVVQTAGVILQRAIEERVSVIMLEPQPERLVLRFRTGSAWRDVLTLPTNDELLRDALALPPLAYRGLILRYKHMAQMRIQVEPLDDFGWIPIRYRDRDYYWATFTRVVDGREQMYLHFVRESPASPLSVAALTTTPPTPCARTPALWDAHSRGWRRARPMR